MSDPSNSVPVTVTPKKAIRFDGTINAGNILTIALTIAGMLIWGIHQEDRITQEADLRQKLEVKVDAGFADIGHRIDEDANAAKDRADDIKTGLRRLDDKIQQILVASLGGQRDVPSPDWGPQSQSHRR